MPRVQSPCPPCPGCSLKVDRGDPLPYGESVAAQGWPARFMPCRKQVAWAGSMPARSGVPYQHSWHTSPERAVACFGPAWVTATTPPAGVLVRLSTADMLAPYPSRSAPAHDGLHWRGAGAAGAGGGAGRTLRHQHGRQAALFPDLPLSISEKGARQGYQPGVSHGRAVCGRCLSHAVMVSQAWAKRMGEDWGAYYSGAGKGGRHLPSF